jgi:hypothetical protein
MRRLLHELVEDARADSAWYRAEMGIGDADLAAIREWFDVGA